MKSLEAQVQLRLLAALRRGLLGTQHSVHLQLSLLFLPQLLCLLESLEIHFLHCLLGCLWRRWSGQTRTFGFNDIWFGRRTVVGVHCHKHLRPHYHVLDLASVELVVLVVLPVVVLHCTLVKLEQLVNGLSIEVSLSYLCFQFKHIFSKVLWQFSRRS